MNKSKIKCVECGSETPKLGRNQKTCKKCRRKHKNEQERLRYKKTYVPHPLPQKKIVKGWLWLFPLDSRPTVAWNKPTEQEVRLANSCGTIIVPCTITYTLPTKSKK